MTIRTLQKRIVCTALCSLLSGWAFALPDIPVFLKESVPPNILLTLDDSGSMAWAYVPDNLSGVTSTNRFLAASFNPVQYNPATTYLAPPKADGTRYTTSFTAAWHDGYLRVNNTPLNLSSGYRPTSSYTAGNAGHTTTITTGVAAYYYVFDSALGTCSPVNTGSDNCYRRVTVSATSGPLGTDERQNFANWYSFYRVRHLLMKSGLLLALGDADPQIRFAWQSLNTCQGGVWNSTSCNDVLGNAYANGMGALTGAQRTRLFSWAAALPSNSGTPLQDAFVRAGNYFRLTNSNSPWLDTPGSAVSAQNACRLSYHVALTDGIWNGSTSSTVGNSDGSNGVLPDGVAYTAAAPFVGASSNSIADLAFSHWRADMQSGIANTTPAFSVTGNNTAPSTWPAAEYWNPRNDPATWQHLVTYTIGLGLGTTLTSPPWKGSTFASDAAGNGYQKFASGAVAWPATGADVIPGNVYDLWHAAINGRGEFFSADSPEAIYKAFQSVLTRINARSGAVGNVSTASAYLFSNTLAYQTTYLTSGWSGRVAANRFNRDGTPGPEVWSTDQTMVNLDYTARNLYTRQLKTAANPTPGVIPFRWASMNADTRLALKTEDTVKWLAGQQILEQDNPLCTSGCIFRQRTKLLGDILGSSAVVSSDQDFGYKTNTWAGAGDAYRTYLTAKAARTPLLLVGSNDGFVHGLNANNGTELFGYAPGSIVDKLWRLSETVYVKKAYVDGPITIGDAYINSAWKTFAVGTMGPGAKSVYALDITNPNAFSDTSVKWEFSHASLGYVLSKPIIARLPNGTWAAIFSGGYENTANSAALFVVNLETGVALSVLPMTKTSDACGTTPAAAVKNGMGAPRAFTTVDGEFFVYAGDLWGHMWRFEYQSSSGSIVTSYNNSPMFNACNASNIAQAITAAPSVISLGASPFVYFGTGRLFDTGDTALTTVNSLYAVIDDGVAQTGSRTSLLGQQTVSTLNSTARRVSTNAVNLVQKRGWFVDMPSSGERIISSPVFIDERVAFTTLVPATEACESKGISWLFELSSLNGAALPEPVLDLNDDGKFTNADKVTGVAPSAKAIDATVGGVTTIKSSAVPERGAGGSGAAGQCSGGNVGLITSNVYTPDYAKTCTPGSTFRSGWRQIR